MKTILALLFTSMPLPAFASGGYEALFAVFGLQLALFIWPMLLPLFFVASAMRKLRAYLTMLVCIYGILGLVNLPINLIYQLAPWLSLETVYQHSFAFAMVVQALAFAISVVVIRKHRSALMAF